MRHRRAVDTEKQRERKKVFGKGEWFKGRKNQDLAGKLNQTEPSGKRKRDQGGKGEKKRQDREPTTVMFVPRTKGGELAKLLKQKEEELGRVTSQRVRIVERFGERLEHILTKPDPFGDSKCEKTNCLMCLTSKKEGGRCKKTNLVYKIECTICKTQGREGVHWGETARSAQKRGGGHWDDYQSGRETSHMRQHVSDKHPEIDPEKPAHNWFEMETHRRFRSALERQLGEALCISRAGGAGAENLLNRKEEYSRCIVPELTIEEGWRGDSGPKRGREPQANQIEPSHPTKRQRLEIPEERGPRVEKVDNETHAAEGPVKVVGELERNDRERLSEQESEQEENTTKPNPSRGITATRHPKTHTKVTHTHTKAKKKDTHAYSWE